SRQTPTTDPLDDILALDVSGGSSENPDCQDFSTQRQAQAYFDARGWSKDDDPYRLDQGGAPGVACEDLPSPPNRHHGHHVRQWRRSRSRLGLVTDAEGSAHLGG